MRRVAAAYLCLAAAATNATSLDLTPVCPPDRPELAAGPLAALHKKAEALMATDPDEAVALICSTIRRVEREQGPDAYEYGWWVGALATPLIAFQNKLSESIPLLEVAQPILERELGQNAPELADIHVAYAWIYFRQGRLADAGKEWQRTIEIRELAPGVKKIELQKALVGLAQVKLSQRDFAAARTNLDRAYAIVLENDEAVSEAAAAIESAYANLALREEDYAAMRRHAEATLRIERELSHTEAQLVPAHIMLGRALERLNEFDASERALSEAIRLSEGDEGPLQRHTLAALTELAAMLNERDEPARAQPVATRAVELGDKTLGPKAPRMVRVLQNLAEAERALGNLPQALAAYDRAAAIVAESSSDVERQTLVAYQSGRGDLEWTLGETDESRASFDRGLATAANDPTLAVERAGVLLGLAHTWARADPPTAHGYLEQALVLLQERLPDSHPMILRVVNDLCGIEARESPTDTPSCSAASERLAASRNVDPSLAAAVYANQSELAERNGHADEARSKAVLSLASAETLGTPAALWTAYFRVARLLTKDSHGDRTLAIFFGKLSVRQIERQRERLVGEYRRFDRPFLQDKVEVYRALADWLMEDGRIDEGLQVLRLLKSEELWDFVARSVDDDEAVALSPRESMLGEAYAAALRANAVIGERLERLARLGEAERLSAEERSQLATLIAEHREEARSRAQRIARLIAGGAPDQPAPRPRAAFHANSLARELERYGPDTAVAVYLLTATHLRILIATTNGQTEARVDLDRAALQRDIGNYLDAITRRADIGTASRGLYSTLAARLDAEATKANAKRLVLWLDGALRYVPFAALTNESGPLIDRYTIESFADTAVHADPRPTPQRALRVRGLGVTRAVAGFAALPAVADELCYLVRGPIAGLGARGGACADTERPSAAIEGEGFIDDAFTAGRLVDPLRQPADFSVLHLGTHFSLRPGNALRSFIVLGDGNRLTLERIGALDFRGIELVTLSACQTALGGATSDDGRELEALSALVQRRGAKRVVASLWPVEDTSTAALMRTMYRTFVVQPLDASAALRTAQLAVRTNAASAHPYFWAGFVASGGG